MPPGCPETARRLISAGVLTKERSQLSLTPCSSRTQSRHDARDVWGSGQGGGWDVRPLGQTPSRAHPPPRVRPRANAFFSLTHGAAPWPALEHPRGGNLGTEQLPVPPSSALGLPLGLPWTTAHRSLRPFPILIKAPFQGLPFPSPGHQRWPPPGIQGLVLGEVPWVTSILLQRQVRSCLLSPSYKCRNTAGVDVSGTLSQGWTSRALVHAETLDRALLPHPPYHTRGATSGTKPSATFCFPESLHLAQPTDPGRSLHLCSADVSQMPVSAGAVWDLGHRGSPL